MNETQAKTKKSILDRFQNAIEKGANKLPPPFILFFYLFIITAVISLLVTIFGVEAINPSNGETVTANNFFSADGIIWLVTNMVKNFTGYASLGLVMTMTVGLGMMEQTGMVAALLKKLMGSIPSWAITYGCAVIAICGNIFSDSCSFIIPPLVALVFLSFKKHPIAGLCVGLLGTSAGFTANLIPAGTDALLAGITNTVLDSTLGPGVYNVEVVCNWFFMIVSTFFLALIITLFEKYIMSPRLGPYVPGQGEGGEVIDLSMDITPIERKGLRAAGLSALAYIAIIVVGIWSGILRNAETGSLLNSPFLSGIVPILFGLFFITGYYYAKTTGNIKTKKDIADRVIAQVRTMAVFIAFVFSAGQFVALFNWTKLGTLLSIGGANFLEATGFTGIPLLVLFILVCACINLLVGSSSAKWTILAPIFIPMFMRIGYDPAFIQLTYRLGDSCTNACSPMSAALFMCLGIAQIQYDKKATLGTLLSNNIMGSLLMLVGWIVFFVIYNALGIPIGPGVEIALPAGIM